MSRVETVSEFLARDGHVTMCPSRSAKGASNATFKMHIRFGRSRRRSYRMLHSLEISHVCNRE